MEAQAKARALEIVEKTGATRIMLIDDHLASGKSMENAMESFSTLPKELQVQTQAFVFSSSDEHLMPDGSWSDVRTYAREHHITIGSTVQEVEDGARIRRGNFDGLSYRRREDKSSLMGVQEASGKKYVERSPDADAEKMRALRREMAAIGKEAVLK